jgi:hypothetical protein
LGILEIDNDYSAENLVRRHIKAVSDIKLTLPQMTIANDNGVAIFSAAV